MEDKRPGRMMNKDSNAQLYNQVSDQIKTEGKLVF